MHAHHWRSDGVMAVQDAQGEAVNVWTNFQRYGLQSPVGLLRADAHRPPFRDDLSEIFDAVVGDPPYGVSCMLLPVMSSTRWLVSG